MRSSDGDESVRTAARARRIEELFGLARELEIGQRESFLRAECADDVGLLQELRSLLAAHDEGEATSWRGIDLFGARMLLEEDPRDQGAGGLPDDDASQGDRVVGRYRLHEEIGRGGMGVVYRATRDDGAFTQTVALKLLHPTAGEIAVRRFTRERQILATLEHPSIARLLDGGISDRGEPYLVVELVDGVPIDRYCAERRVDLEQRVRLLACVCSAVQAAHQRLVVHRDIKPSNILVSGDGRPKLLDFGIAKLLEEADVENESSHLTRTRHNPMTVQYASPEQFRGEPVTVSSDVYQLGLVAYELLTGVRPYDLRGISSAETARLITDLDPPPPSSRSRAAGRSFRLPRDLDTIVLKALAKEQSKRYASAADLQRDLERFLEGRPIAARPATFLYRGSRWLQRNAVPATVGAVALVLLIASSLAFTLQLVRERDRSREAAALAERQRPDAAPSRDQAAELVEFVATLFHRTSPQHVGGGPVSALELLAAGRREIDRRTFERPETRARLLTTLGTLYRRYGDFDAAEQLQVEALTLLRIDGQALSHPVGGERGDEEIPQLLLDQVVRAGEAAVHAIWEMARLCQARFQYTSSRYLLRLVLEALGRANPTSAHRGPLLADLAAVVQDAGDPELALQLAEQAAELMRLDPRDRPSLADALTRKANALSGLGQFEATLSTLTEAIEILRETSPGSDNLVAALNTLAVAHDRLGDPASALEVFEEADRVSRTAFALGHPGRIVARSNRAMLLRRLGRPEEAEALLRQEIGSFTADKNMHLHASLQGSLAATLADQDRHEEALAAYGRALSLLRGSLPDDHPTVAIHRNNRGESLVALAREAEARADFDAALAIFEQRVGADHLYTSYPLLNLAELDAAQGDLAAAVTHAERAFRIRAAVQGPRGEDSAEAFEVWVGILRRMGREDDAAAAEAQRDD